MEGNARDLARDSFQAGKRHFAAIHLSFDGACELLHSPAGQCRYFPRRGRSGETTMLKQILSGALLFRVTLVASDVAGAADDKAAELGQAIAACDKGASAPLEPDARAPAVHLSEFFPKAGKSDYVAWLPSLKALAAQCALAKDGAPDQKRLQL